LTSQVTWASATTSVATIDAAGKATAVAAGTSSISAKLGTVTGSTVLTVIAAALQSIAVTPANPTVAAGLTQQFTATGTYSDNSTHDLTGQVTWASATTSVATIDAAGKATAVAAGTSNISAKLGAVTGSTVLTVTGQTILSPVSVKDNSQGGYYQYGAWVTVSGGYNGTYEVVDPQTAPTASNRYNLTVTVGSYDFYATWVAGASNATNAAYAVYDGVTKLNSFQANQQQAPGDGQYGGVSWAKLGTITVTNGKLTIAMLASGANGDLVADGILLTASGSSAAARAMVGSTGVSTSSPTTIPMGPTATGNSSGTDQSVRGTSGAPSSMPVVVTTQGSAAILASPITVSDPDSSASADAGPTPSTTLTDHAIVEIMKGHRRQHHKSILKRLAGGKAPHSYVATRPHHPER
jgi:hypothetical protein